MNFLDLTKIFHKEINEKTIINYQEIKDLCKRSYPNHLKGCPNIKKCAFLNIPSFSIIQEVANFKHFYLIYATFDFKKYQKIRKKEHPNWTKRQLKNVLYWQGSIKKMISDYINQLDLNKKEDYLFGCGSGMKVNFQDRVGSMENSCINVFSTMKLNKIKMEIHPENIIYLVCLLCSKKKVNFTKQVKLFN